MDIAFDHHHTLLEVHRHAAQVVRVHLDAGPLHVNSTGSRRRSICSYSASPELKRNRGRSTCQKTQRHVGLLGA